MNTLATCLARCLIASLAVTAAAASHALSFEIAFTPSTDARSQSAFRAAADRWSGLISDDVTVRLTFGSGLGLSSGALGETTPLYVGMFYSDFHARLAGASRSAADAVALASLPGGASFDRLINRTADHPAGPGSAAPYVDGSTIGVRLSAANARVLGTSFGSSTSPGCATACDALVRVNSRYAYDYDPSDGIGAGLYDFVGIATHEIGHALGFFSGVDVLDGSRAALPAGGYNFVNSLDLFRYSALSASAGMIDFTADDRAKFFSIDGGATLGPEFAQGQRFGDGDSASHWKNGSGVGALQPRLDPGLLAPAIGSADLLAMDVIGWTISPVPEPATAVMLLVGLIVLVCAPIQPRSASASSMRALSQSRRTVRSVRSSASAISAFERPPK